MNPNSNITTSCLCTYTSQCLFQVGRQIAVCCSRPSSASVRDQRCYESQKCVLTSVCVRTSYYGRSLVRSFAGQFSREVKVYLVDRYTNMLQMNCHSSTFKSHVLLVTLIFFWKTKHYINCFFCRYTHYYEDAWSYKKF